MQRPAPAKPHKMRVIFSKEGTARFISHLDLVRLFQRASRRASLPVALSQGFNPHLKISILRALKLGVASTSEEAVIAFSEPIAPAVVVEAFNLSLPQGVRMVRAEEIP